MSRVLLTGASGLLGLAVLSLLRQQGDEVVAAVRQPPAQGQDGVQYVAFDLSEPESWYHLPPEVDAVIHCGALIPDHFGDLSQADRLWQVNGLGTLQLLTWARNNQIPRFVNCSSYIVYARPLPYPVTEDHATYPAGHATPYAVSKLAGELFATSLNSPGFQVCSLRFPSLYGPGMKAAGVLHRFIGQAAASEVIHLNTHPETQFDFVDTRDAAQAVYKAVTVLPHHTVYNAGSGRGATLREVAEAAWTVFGPGTPIRLTVAADLPPPAHAVLDISRARQDIDYQPACDIRSGLDNLKSQWGR
jgi:nucleoside-diphosphate-sugar epimerase